MRCTLTQGVVLSYWCLHAEHANDLQLVSEQTNKYFTGISVFNLLLLVQQVPRPPLFLRLLSWKEEEVTITAETRGHALLLFKIGPNECDI